MGDGPLVLANPEPFSCFDSLDSVGFWLVDFGGIRFRVSLTFVVSLVPFVVLIAMANRRIGSLALQISLCSAGHYCYLHSLPHKMHLHY